MGAAMQGGVSLDVVREEGVNRGGDRRDKCSYGAFGCIGVERERG